MEAGIPEKSSPYADEGTFAHEVAAKALAIARPIDRIDYVLSQYPESEDPDNVARADAVIEYINYVDQACWYKQEKGFLMVEVRVPLIEAYGQGEQFGTSDAIIAFPKHKHLRVIDLKFGKGVEVYAKDNEQALSYSLGAVEYMEPLEFVPETIESVIHQPRRNHVDSNTINYAQMMDFKAAARVAAMTALKAKKGEYLNPGEKQCRWCKAFATCPAASAAVEDATTDAIGHIPDGPVVQMADNDALGLSASKREFVEIWLNAVTEELNSRVLKGQKIPDHQGGFYKVVEGRAGNAAWDNPGTVEPLLVGVLGEQAHVKKLISPTEATKLLKHAKVDLNDTLFSHVTRARGKPTVVPSTDKRPEYSEASDESAFDDL